MSKGKVLCDNCGSEHYAPDFPHPCDKAKIKKAKEDLTACRGGGGGGGGHVVGRQSDRKKCSKNNYNKDGDINYYVYGVKNRGNAWMGYFCCQECGWNTTHTYGFYDAWKRDTGNFVLPYDHNYWKLSVKTAGVVTSNRASEGVGQSIKDQHRLAIYEVISCHHGKVSNAIFFSFLTDLSKVLEHLKY